LGGGRARQEAGEACGQEGVGFARHGRCTFGRESKAEYAGR